MTCEVHSLKKGILVQTPLPPPQTKPKTKPLHSFVLERLRNNKLRDRYSVIKWSLLHTGGTPFFLSSSLLGPAFLSKSLLNLKKQYKKEQMEASRGHLAMQVCMTNQCDQLKLQTWGSSASRESVELGWVKVSQRSKHRKGKRAQD
jgi:hypothetical protein